MLLAICGLLVSCGGEAQLAVTPTQIAVATATHAATPRPVETPTVTPPTIGPVVWTTSVDAMTGAPLDSVSTYSPDAPQIIAVIRASSLPAGSTINADWTYNNTSLDAFATRMTLDRPSPEQWIVFRMERTSESMWPVGAYAIAISLNGARVVSSSIDVADVS